MVSALIAVLIDCGKRSKNTGGRINEKNLAREIEGQTLFSQGAQAGERVSSFWTLGLFHPPGQQDVASGEWRTTCNGYSNLGLSLMSGMKGCQTMYWRSDPEGIRTPDLHRDRVAC
jgi:hypothetical protein